MCIAMTLAQQRISETLMQFYDETSPLCQLSMKFAETSRHLDQEVRTTMDNEYRVTVLEPLGRLASYFPDINEAIKRRSKKLLDYDSVRSKVRKLVEKPSEDHDKLPKVHSALFHLITNHELTLSCRLRSRLWSQIMYMIL